MFKGHSLNISRRGIHVTKRRYVTLSNGSFGLKPLFWFVLHAERTKYYGELKLTESQNLKKGDWITVELDEKKHWRLAS